MAKTHQNKIHLKKHQLTIPCAEKFVQFCKFFPLTSFQAVLFQHAAVCKHLKSCVSKQHQKTSAQMLASILPCILLTFYQSKSFIKLMFKIKIVR